MRVAQTVTEDVVSYQAGLQGLEIHRNFCIFGQLQNLLEHGRLTLIFESKAVDIRHDSLAGEGLCHVPDPRLRLPPSMEDLPPVLHEPPPPRVTVTAAKPESAAQTAPEGCTVLKHTVAGKVSAVTEDKIKRQIFFTNKIILPNIRHQSFAVQLLPGVLCKGYDSRRADRVQRVEGGGRPPPPPAREGGTPAGTWPGPCQPSRAVIDRYL